MKLVTNGMLRRAEELAAPLVPLAIHVHGEWYLVRDDAAPAGMPPIARRAWVKERLETDDMLRSEGRKAMQLGISLGCAQAQAELEAQR